jgi:hypothetical protein
MSKSVEVSKTSGAHAFAGGKNHEKPAHPHGAVDTKKHEQSLKIEGALANAKKPLVHSEQVGVTHSGRALPEETILKDSKIITSAGRPAKRNEK